MTLPEIAVPNYISGSTIKNVIAKKKINRMYWSGLSCIEYYKCSDTSYKNNKVPLSKA
jgi:hypothetical protein